MSCEECLPLIDLYFDGELDGCDAARVDAHVAACAACAAALGRLGREQELYLSYECDAEAADGFWDGVMSKAAADARAREGQRPAGLLRARLMAALATLAAPRFSPTLTAAMLLAAVLVTAAVMSYLGPRAGDEPPAARRNESAQPPTPPAREEIARGDAARDDEEKGLDDKGVKAPGVVQDETAPRRAAPRERAVVKAAGAASVGGRDARQSPPALQAEQEPDRLVREAEQKYVAAIRLLARDVGRRRSRIDPDTLAGFERTLAAVDRSIADTRRAAREHPRDPVAVQYMLTAYAKKVEVLREMTRY